MLDVWFLRCGIRGVCWRCGVGRCCIRLRVWYTLEDLLRRWKVGCGVAGVMECLKVW